MKPGGLLQGLIATAAVVCLSIPLRDLGPDYWFIFSLTGLTALVYSLTERLSGWLAAWKTRRAKPVERKKTSPAPFDDRPEC